MQTADERLLAPNMAVRTEVDTCNTAGAQLAAPARTHCERHA